ncbi:hypothetical protein Scep_029604 [Stephania cephalantha]|uniref:Uncharacterized protein n=1 Tax=Stephania cephalantha TaxID=152367 RepID=A0AAP0E1B0_9MAGN
MNDNKFILVLQVVKFSFRFRVLFIVFIFFILGFHLSKLKAEKSQAPYFYLLLRNSQKLCFQRFNFIANNLNCLKEHVKGLLRSLSLVRRHGKKNEGRYWSCGSLHHFRDKYPLRELCPKCPVRYLAKRHIKKEETNKD